MEFSNRDSIVLTEVCSHWTYIQDEVAPVLADWIFVHAWIYHCLAGSQNHLCSHPILSFLDLMAKFLWNNPMDHIFFGSLYIYLDIGRFYYGGSIFVSWEWHIHAIQGLWENTTMWVQGCIFSNTRSMRSTLQLV